MCQRLTGGGTVSHARQIWVKDSKAPFVRDNLAFTRATSWSTRPSISYSNVDMLFWLSLSVCSVLKRISVSVYVAPPVLRGRHVSKGLAPRHTLTTRVVVKAIWERMSKRVLTVEGNSVDQPDR